MTILEPGEDESGEHRSTGVNGDADDGDCLEAAVSSDLGQLHGGSGEQARRHVGGVGEPEGADNGAPARLTRNLQAGGEARLAPG